MSIKEQLAETLCNYDYEHGECSMNWQEAIKSEDEGCKEYYLNSAEHLLSLLSAEVDKALISEDVLIAVSPTSGELHKYAIEHLVDPTKENEPGYQSKIYMACYLNKAITAQLQAVKDVLK